MTHRIQNEMRERLLAETERDLTIALEQREDPLAKYNLLVAVLRSMESQSLPKNKILRKVLVH